MGLATAGGLGMGKFTPEDRVCWSRVPVALIVGNLVMLNHAATGAETVEGDVEDGRPGMDSAIESNVVLPEAAFLKHGMFGVVKSLMNGAGADNTKVLVSFSGLVDMLVDDAAASDADEAIIARDADAVALADVDGNVALLGQKYLGYLREATAGAAAGDVTVSVMFDGINGIGSALDQA